MVDVRMYSISRMKELNTTKATDVINWRKIDICKLNEDLDSFPVIRDFLDYVSFYREENDKKLTILYDRPTKHTTELSIDVLTL